MDERNSLARSDQKGSLSLSVSLSFRCCPHANVSPRHACQHRFQVRSISRFSSLSFSHPTWQRYIRFVAKILRRVTYSLQLQESFVSFFIGIAYRFAKLIEGRVFFFLFSFTFDTFPKVSFESLFQLFLSRQTATTTCLDGPVFSGSEEMRQSCENRWRVIEGRGEAILRAQWDEIMPTRSGERALIPF